MDEIPTKPVFENLHRVFAGADGTYEKFSALHQQLDDEGRTNLGTMLLERPGMAPFGDSDGQISMKSSKISVNHWNDGNKQFSKNIEEAVLSYSKCIAAAPYPSSDKEGSEELALGFANRSACYFVLKKYDACLRDIVNALMFDYPAKLKHKLLERRAKCYQSMGRREDARASAQEAKDCLQAATDLPEDKMESIVAALSKIHLNPGDVQCNPYAAPDALKPLPKLSFKRHPNIPSAADCLEVKYSKEVGRHIVATRDIGPGDTIIIEKPFAVISCPDTVWYTSTSHCFNCIKRSDAMIPCKTCNYAMYCSDECRGIAWKTYHNIECRVIPELKALDVGSRSLYTLRVFLTACSKSQGLEGLRRLVEELDSEEVSREEMKGFDKDGQYTSTDYRQIHYLQRNRCPDQWQQLMGVTIAGSILNALEKYSDFFSSTTSNKASRKSKEFASGLIIKLLETLYCNSTSLGELVIRGDVFEVPEFAGCGVCSTLNLLAHSCDPNTFTSCYNGSTVALTAGRPIIKGEMICISYVPQTLYYTKIPIATRHSALHIGYDFHCNCHACAQNWPLAVELSAKCAFLCHKCRCPLLRSEVRGKASCAICKKKYQVSVLGAKLIEICTKMEYFKEELLKGSTQDNTAEIAKSVTFVYQNLLMPNLIGISVQLLLEKSVKAKGDVIYYNGQ